MIVVVDCSSVSTVEAFWQAYVDAAEPEEAKVFGRNLDALWDAVEGGGPGWPGDVKLVFTHTRTLANLRTPGGGSFLKALQEIARDATRLEIEVT